MKSHRYYINEESTVNIFSATTILFFLTQAALNAGEMSLQWSERPSRNMVSEEVGLPDTLTNENQLLEIPLSSHQYSFPFIDQDKIYVGINDYKLRKDPHYKPSKGGLIAALDINNGKTQWQLPVPKFYGEGHFFNTFQCGICSTPVIDGNRIYVVGSRGEVLCLDANGLSDGNNGPYTDESLYVKASLKGDTMPPAEQRGDIIWSFNIIEELKVFPHDVIGSTILKHKDCLYICTSNGQRVDHKTVANPQAPSLFVLHKDTGKLLAVDNEMVGTRMLHGQWSSPSFGTVNGKELVFWGGGDGFLYAFEAVTPSDKVQTLRTVWKMDCNPAQYRQTNGQQNTYSSWRRKIKTGPSEIIGTPVFYDNKVYIAIGQSPMHGPGQGNLVCVNANDGSKLWESQLVDRTTGTVAVCGGLLYIADYSGNLHCFDAVKGGRIWVEKLKAGTWISSPLVADGKVYISDEKNNFYIFKAGRETELLFQRKFRSMAMTPVIKNKKLYLPLQKKLLVFSENE